MSKPGEGDGAQGGEGTSTGTITVGEKTYTADDVSAMLKDQANASQALQKAAPVLQLAEKFGTDVDGLVRHVEGSTLAINKLIDAGLIDDEGNIVEKASQGSQGNEDFLQKLLAGADNGDAGSQLQKTDKTILTALQSIKADVGRVNEKISGLEGENAALKRQLLSDKIKKEYSGLDDADISKAMATAGQKGISLRAALDDINKAKEESTAALRQTLEKEIVEKLGLNEEQVKKFREINEFKELGPGGGAAALASQKKISFRGGDGAVTPRQLMEDFFRKQPL